MCISGKVAGHKRQEMVNALQSSPSAFDVLILSPKAGGVGLTITAANNVIHLSRWWNPAVADQATDRAYRIGQTRPVRSEERRVGKEGGSTCRSRWSP